MAHQIWFWLKSCRGRFLSRCPWPSGSCLRRGRGCSAVVRGRRAARGAGWSRSGDAVPVDVGEPQADRRVGAYLADDHPHALRPVDRLSSSVTSATQAPSRTWLVGVDRRGPRLLWDPRQRLSKSPGSVNPTEYDERCDTTQSRNS
jgi:hypothetical protein